MKRLLVLFLLLAPTVCWAVPDTTLTVTPTAVSGSTITASDENSRNNAISTAYNAHSHTDIASTTANTYTVGNNAAGSKAFAVDNQFTTSPSIRYNDTSERWQASNDASVFADIPLPTSVVQGDVIYRNATVWTRLGAGTAGQALTTAGASANPAFAGMTTQGDVEYHNGTTRTRLAPGTSGQFLKTQGAAANPVWATLATSAKSGSFTRDLTLASGNQSITGVGFKPAWAVFFAERDSTAGEASWGLDAGSGPNGFLDNNASTAGSYANTSVSIYLQESTTTNNYQGRVTTFDSDGFTIVWTKNGTPTGTGTISYLVGN